MGLHMEIGRSIRLLRTARGISQKELAETVGCSNNYLSLVERGRRTPSIRFVDQIGTALDVPTSQLFALADDDVDIRDPTRRQLVDKLKRLILSLSENQRK